MSSKLIVENEPCLNCGDFVNGPFCKQCGQKAVDHTDRSMIRLVGDFFGNLFFLDNRLFVSLKYLLFSPGLMTKEFLKGKRKKFLPPISLFLFANLVYFLVSPITDFSLPLYDQIQSQPTHSTLAKKMVKARLLEREISYEEYALSYNKATDNISKTAIILNIPMIALFVYLVSFRRNKFYFDSLIFSFHFFTMLLLFIVAVDSADRLLEHLLGVSMSSFLFAVVVLGVPLLYLISSFKKLLNTNWILSALTSLVVLIGVMVSHFLYRAIIFFLTFYST